MRLGLGSWLDLCNRHERLTTDVITNGRTCEWRDSSQLTVGRVFPRVADRLLQHCIAKWPVRFNFDSTPCLSEIPTASVLMAIGGGERLPQFYLALAALRSQTHQALEVIVVEQGPTASLQRTLPVDVRYEHDLVAAGTPFNKSRALNRAAAVARGDVLLIHDADFVVPVDYAAEVTQSLRGVSGVRPARFIFYLDQPSTVRLMESRAMTSSSSVEYVTQNTPCPMALKRSTYWDIGGHDESFVGWGGEDVEFLSRLRTLTVAEGGWLPTIHLWHPSAPRKASGHRNQRQQDELLATDPRVRIERLRSCQRHE